MEQTPRITVTIPTYNRARLVGDAVKSVLEQSVAGVEVYVSDNASTDDTEAVVARIGDSRVHYVRNAQNLGVHANLSRGLELGSAPVVCVLPDDDVMLPGNLEAKLRVLDEHPSVDIVHGPSLLVHVDDDGSQLRSNVYYTGGTEPHVAPARDVLHRLLSDDYWINFPAALIRRRAVGDVRFDPTDELADDLGLFMRLCCNARDVAYVAEPLVALRMHAQAHSTVQGFHGLAQDAFLPDVTAVAHITAGRERFLATYGDRVDDPDELRRASREWARRKLVWIAGQRVNSDAATRRSALEVCARAIRTEPALSLDPRMLKLVVKGAAGSGVYRRLRPASRVGGKP